MSPDVENILCKIAANVICYGISKLGGSIKPNKTDNEIDIKALIKAEFNNYIDSPLDSGVFHNYLNSPQVSDIIQNYIFYSITGIASEKLKSFKNFKISKAAINEDDVIEYLTQNALDIFSEPLTTPKRNDIEKFFTKIFVCAKKYFESTLTNNDKYLIFLINSRIDLMADNINKSLTIAPRQNIPNYSNIRDKYNSLIKKNNEMGFIYGISDFKLKEFYVFPELEKDNSVRGAFHNYFMFNFKDNETVSRTSWSVPTGLPGYGSLYKWTNIFDTSNIIYVIGGAGFGKSLFLKNIINNYDKMNVYENARHLLIYCDLKSYYRNTNVTSYSILDFLKDSMINSTGFDKIDKDFLEHYLNIGRCVILFDALDEVHKEHRNHLHTLIINFFSEYNSNNKVCITSRDRGFIPKEDIEVFNICVLNREQIETYLDNMIKLRYFNKSDKESFLQQADVLMKKKFLNNFLALSLLVSIYKAERELPENKLELYSKCFEYIAKKREKEKSKTKHDWELIEPLMKDSTFIELSLLACPNNKNVDENVIKNRLLQIYTSKYADECKAENAINAFLDFCSERTELFVNSNEDGKFKFFHRSFFEYFYSKFIIRSQKPEDIYKLFLQFDVDSEVFELTISMVKNVDEEKYQAILDYIFDMVKEDFENQKVSLIQLNILTLIMQVVDDEKYKDMYFYLFIKYKNIINGNQKKLRNFDIIENVISKNISESEKRKGEFYEYYKNDAFMGILLYIGDIWVGPGKLVKNNISLVNSRQEYTLHADFKIFANNGLILNIIFKNYNVLDLANEYLSKNDNEFQKLIYEYTRDKKVRRRLRKHFKTFKEFNNNYIEILSTLMNK